MRGCFALTVIIAMTLAPPARSGQPSFDSDGVKIAYLDVGRGEPIVLLHGFSVSAVEMWLKKPFAPTPIIPVLAQDYRVIAPDLRGHGNSDKPHDPKAYGRTIAEDVIRLLDHLEVRKAHVVGYSMGATVAGRLLVDHPDRLLSVTFGGGGPLFCPAEEVTDLMNATAESLERGDGLGPLLLALIPEGEYKPSLAYANMVSQWALRGKDRKALAAVMRSQCELAVTEAELAAVTTPVSFVYGSREAACKRTLIARAQQALPKATVTVVDGGDHISTAGRPEFLEAVLVRARGNPALVPVVAPTAVMASPAASAAGE
jgi:pimeloyl-ACP methyl ester carboxylesterase